jgi:hypothetical protein
MRLLLFVMMMPLLSQAQELLVTTDGRELRFESYRLSDDGSMIEVRTCPACLNPVPVDSVAEMISLVDEKIYHLKRIHVPSLKLAFLELLTSGTITVYKRTSELREKGSAGQVPKRPKGWADYTAVEQYFLEKNGFLKQVLPAYGSPLEQGLLLKEFVSDDAQSVRMIDNVEFKLDPASLIGAVDDYNARAFAAQELDETEGLVSFLIIRDRRVKDSLQVIVNGETSTLTSQVFTWRVPVSADSKLCFSINDRAKCLVVRGTRHFPLFYEVRVGQEIEIKRSQSKRFSKVAGRASNTRGR